MNLGEKKYIYQMKNWKKGRSCNFIGSLGTNLRHTQDE